MRIGPRLRLFFEAVIRSRGHLSSHEAVLPSREAGTSIADRELVERVQNGDAEAFAVLFEAYRHQVHRIARAITGDPEAAKDVVQETFIKVHAALAGWRGDSSLQRWISRIAVRAAIDERRRQARHPSGSSVEEPVDDPRGRLESGLALRRVQELAERLPGQQGAILRLRLFGELSNREIAEILSLREPNVRMQLTKAIRRLRELL